MTSNSKDRTGLAALQTEARRLFDNITTNSQESVAPPQRPPVAFGIPTNLNWLIESLAIPALPSSRIQVRTVALPVGAIRIVA